MHVAVVGGGVIGALSAYYLEQRGARVTLFERAPELAAGTSGMNAAQLSYSYVSPLGSPAVYSLLRKVVAGQVEDVRVTKWLDPQLLSWGLRLLRESSKERYAANQNALLALALESRDLMAAFRRKHAVDFDYKENGKLHLYTSRNQVETARAFAGVLARCGIRQEILSPEECFAREPALKDRRGPLAGGLFSPADPVGDCQKFVHETAKLFGPGISCRMGVTVRKIHARKKEFRGVETDSGEKVEADAVLVCAGAESYGLLRAAGVRVPLYPVKGYSVTLEDSGISIGANVTDHLRRVAFAPLGGRVRMAGFMHFSGYDAAVSSATREKFLGLVTEVFPAARLKDPRIEVGFRPYTPTSTPVVGSTKVEGLFVNIGHAMLGWTLAHATCRRAALAIVK